MSIRYEAHGLCAYPDLLPVLKSYEDVTFEAGVAIREFEDGKHPVFWLRMHSERADECDITAAVVGREELIAVRALIDIAIGMHTP